MLGFVICDTPCGRFGRSGLPVSDPEYSLFNHNIDTTEMQEPEQGNFCTEDQEDSCPPEVRRSGPRSAMARIEEAYSEGVIPVMFLNCLEK